MTGNADPGWERGRPPRANKTVLLLTLLAWLLLPGSVALTAGGFILTGLACLLVGLGALSLDFHLARRARA